MKNGCVIGFAPVQRDVWKRVDGVYEDKVRKKVIFNQETTLEQRNNSCTGKTTVEQQLPLLARSLL